MRCTEERMIIKRRKKELVIFHCLWHKFISDQRSRFFNDNVIFPFQQKKLYFVFGLPYWHRYIFCKFSLRKCNNKIMIDLNRVIMSSNSDDYELLPHVIWSCGFWSEGGICVWLQQFMQQRQISGFIVGVSHRWIIFHKM